MQTVTLLAMCVCMSLVYCAKVKEDRQHQELAWDDIVKKKHGIQAEDRQARRNILYCNQAVKLAENLSKAANNTNRKFCGGKFLGTVYSW